MASLLSTFFRTIKDGLIAFTSPIRSFFHKVFSKEDNHHQQVGGTLGNYQKENIPKQRIESALNKQKSRNIALFDWDDTIIRWKDKETGKTPTFKSIKHRVINRPTNEPVDIIEGASEFITHLNASGVKTGLVSNKDHEKLLRQTSHHLEKLPFDTIIGHDRTHDFNMRKPSASLPKFMLEKMGVDLSKGTGPVTVMFAGDKPEMDIKSANKLDKWLKSKHHPESSCVSVLINTRKFTKEQIAVLPANERPKVVINNYAELQEIANKTFGIGQEKITAHTVAIPTSHQVIPSKPAISWVDEYNKKHIAEALQKAEKRSTEQVLR